MQKSIIFIHRINETSTKSCGAFEKLLSQSESLSSIGYSVTLVYMHLSTLHVSRFINRKTLEIVYEVPNITMDNEGSKFWKTCSDYFRNHSKVTFYLRYAWFF